jgi:uncharacterized membrane protein YeaQ/YmgE (transglycosylase-associated protein family)
MGIGEILGWIVFGLVAGALARLLHPGRDPMNWIWTIALGIGGSLVGGFVGSQIGVDNRGLSGWVLAVIGAIALLAIHNMLTRRNAAPAGGGRTSDDYKRAVFDDLSRGPRG